MKKIVIIYGTSTGTCEDLAGRIGAKLGVDNIINVTDLDDCVIADNDNLILGTSTWGAGEVQDDWYDGIKVIKNADLSGKTVALFGCGDSESYPDTFAKSEEHHTAHSLLIFIDMIHKNLHVYW